MSVYSGFAFRKQEESYNRLLYNVLCLLQHKQYDDHSLEKYFTKFYRKLQALEVGKHLPPKFTFALKDLATHYNILEKSQMPPTTTSSSTNLSFQQQFTSVRARPKLQSYSTVDQARPVVERPRSYMAVKFAPPKVPLKSSMRPKTRSTDGVRQAHRKNKSEVMEIYSIAERNKRWGIPSKSERNNGRSFCTYQPQKKQDNSFEFDIKFLFCAKIKDRIVNTVCSRNTKGCAKSEAGDRPKTQNQTRITQSSAWPTNRDNNDYHLCVFKL